MSRTDIGNYLGLAVETVSRQFTQFHNESIIDADRKFVKITDLPALYRISGMTYCAVDTTGGIGKIS